MVAPEAVLMPIGPIAPIGAVAAPAASAAPAPAAVAPPAPKAKAKAKAKAGAKAKAKAKALATPRLLARQNNSMARARIFQNHHGRVTVSALTPLSVSPLNKVWLKNYWNNEGLRDMQTKFHCCYHEVIKMFNEQMDANRANHRLSHHLQSWHRLPSIH